jgi:hypothetical protein
LGVICDECQTLEDPLWNTLWADSSYTPSLNSGAVGGWHLGLPEAEVSHGRRGIPDV